MIRVGSSVVLFAREVKPEDRAWWEIIGSEKYPTLSVTKEEAETIGEEAMESLCNRLLFTKGRSPAAVATIRALAREYRRAGYQLAVQAASVHVYNAIRAFEIKNLGESSYPLLSGRIQASSVKAPPPRRRSGPPPRVRNLL